MFHVRPVTQGDVIRADPKEIPRIFQLLYAGEGEARRPDEQQQLDVSSSKADERPLTLQYKGECLIFTMRTHKFPLTSTVLLDKHVLCDSSRCHPPTRLTFVHR